MEFRRLCDTLVEKICSKIRAVEIIQYFNCAVANSLLSEEGRRALYLQLLNVAADHNHTELIAHLLSYIPCMKNRLLKVVVNPLHPLIAAGDLESVELFLCANPTVRVLERFYTDMRDVNINGQYSLVRFHHLSAIEYACIFEQHHILKLLVSYDKDQNHKRTCNGRSEHLICSFNPDAGFLTPLHVVFELLISSSFHRIILASLPATVQLIVDEGACINDYAAFPRRLTPLNLLIYIIEMKRVKFHHCMTSDEREKIVETVEILYTAGAHSNGPIDHNPLDTLHRLVEHMCFLSESDVIAAQSEKDLLLLIPRVTELVLKHGGQLSRSTLNQCGPYSYSVLGHIQILRFAGHLVRRFDGLRHIPGSLVLFEDTMRCLVNMFRYYACIESGINDCDLRANIVGDLVELVFGSSVSAQSVKLLKLMLTTLKASEVQYVASALSDWIDVMLKDPWEITTGIQMDIDSYIRALDLVCQVEIPFSLQHLARREVLRAMSYRSLCSGDVEQLDLPVNVVPYLLLKE